MARGYVEGGWFTPSEIADITGKKPQEIKSSLEELADSGLEILSRRNPSSKMQQHSEPQGLEWQYFITKKHIPYLSGNRGFPEKRLNVKIPAREYNQLLGDNSDRENYNTAAEPDISTPDKIKRLGEKALADYWEYHAGKTRGQIPPNLHKRLNKYGKLHEIPKFDYEKRRKLKGEEALSEYRENYNGMARGQLPAALLERLRMYGQLDKIPRRDDEETIRKMGEEALAEWREKYSDKTRGQLPSRLYHRLKRSGQLDRVPRRDDEKTTKEIGGEALAEYWENHVGKTRGQLPKCLYNRLKRSGQLDKVPRRDDEKTTKEIGGEALAEYWENHAGKTRGQLPSDLYRRLRRYGLLGEIPTLDREERRRIMGEEALAEYWENHVGKTRGQLPKCLYNRLKRAGQLDNLPGGHGKKREEKQPETTVHETFQEIPPSGYKKPRRRKSSSKKVNPEVQAEISKAKQGAGAEMYANLDRAALDLRYRHNIFISEKELEEIVEKYSLYTEGSESEVLFSTTIDAAVSGGLFNQYKPKIQNSEGHPEESDEKNHYSEKKKPEQSRKEKKAGQKKLAAEDDEDSEEGLELIIEEGGILFDDPYNLDEAKLKGRDDETDSRFKDNVLFKYLREMESYSLLTSEEEIELGRGMREVTSDIAGIMFSQEKFFSNYINMVSDENHGLEHLSAVMPDKDYEKTKGYLMSAARKVIEENKLDDVEKKDVPPGLLSETDHEGNSLYRIYKDILTARKGLKKFKSKKARKDVLDELGFESVEHIDDFLGSLEPLFEQYRSMFDRFFTSNLRLVAKIANKYRNKDIPVTDLIQEGNIGLARAVGKFDYRMGYKFSSYATWWIHQSIIRSLAENSRTIRLPVYLSEKIKRIVKAESEIFKESGKKPTAEEIAEHVNMEPAEAAAYMNINRQTHPLSLHMPVGKYEDTPLENLLGDETTDPPDEDVDKGLLKEIIEENLEKLSPRQEKILKMRFGIDESHDHTLEEIGEQFKLSRERIRQIIDKALKKLRHPSVSSMLRPYNE